MRETQFINGGYYHVFNRGIEKRKIFLNNGHYRRFIQTVSNVLLTGSATQRHIYNQGLALNTKVIIVCYCLMPNHYHFLIKQTAENGISEFMHKVNTSYTMYFNINNKRKGRLFEYTFRSKSIETDDVLLHVSRYIHINPVVAGIHDSAESYPWSSFSEYVDRNNAGLCDTKEILEYFSGGNARLQYRQFVIDHMPDARQGKDEEDDIFPY